MGIAPGQQDGRLSIGKPGDQVYAWNAPPQAPRTRFAIRSTLLTSLRHLENGKRKMGLYMKGILPMQWGCTGKDLLYAENENCPLYSQAGRIKTVQREYTRVRDITDRTRPERPATARHGSARHGKPVSPKNTAARLWQSATATARHGTAPKRPNPRRHALAQHRFNAPGKRAKGSTNK